MVLVKTGTSRTRELVNSCLRDRSPSTVPTENSPLPGRCVRQDRTNRAVTWIVFASGPLPGSSPGVFGDRRDIAKRNSHRTPGSARSAGATLPFSGCGGPPRHRCAAVAKINRAAASSSLPLQELRERWLPMAESSQVRGMEAVVPRCSRQAFRRPTRASTRWQPRGRLPCREHRPKEAPGAPSKGRDQQQEAGH